MKHIAICLPTTGTPSVPSLVRMAECGHEIYVSVRFLSAYPNVSFVCLPCSTQLGPVEVEVPEVVLAEAAELFRRRKES